MTASSPLMPGDIGLPAVKCFATPSCVNQLLVPLGLSHAVSFLGGAEFDYASTKKKESLRQELGCPTYAEGFSCLHLTPELIAFNVFAVFFDGTQGEDNLFISAVNQEILDAAKGNPSKRYNTYSSGSMNIQYVDVAYEDVLYANDDKCPPSGWNKYIGWKSMQDLLNQTNYYLHKINNIQYNLPPPTCPNGLPG